MRALSVTPSFMAVSRPIKNVATAIDALITAVTSAGVTVCCILFTSPAFVAYLLSKWIV